MKKRYYDLNSYFKSIYGERVHKIAVDAGFDCPNRDGTLSTGGCIYCNAKGSGTGALEKGLSITRQLIASKRYVVKRFKAKKYLAYFQSFTNTYAPVETLRSLYEEALAVEGVIGLSIGTRPDCVNEPILDLVEGFAKDNMIWIEYGLQSIHDKTLCLINRGHDFKCFEQAVAATKGRSIHICAHVILGLPGETRSDMLETANAIARMNIDGVKLHLLYVVKDTPLEALYRKGSFECLTQEEYVEIACDFIERLPENMVIQRVTSEPHLRELVSPLWSLDKRGTMDMIKQMLETRDTWQGMKTMYGSR